MMAPPIDYRFISGLSLRIFPSDSSGFFFGLGRGVISVNQEVKKTDNQREMEQVEKWKEEDREKKPKIVSAYEKYIKPLGLAIVVMMFGVIFIMIGIFFYNSSAY